MSGDRRRYVTEDSLADLSGPLGQLLTSLAQPVLRGHGRPDVTHPDVALQPGLQYVDIDEDDGATAWFQTNAIDGNNHVVWQVLRGNTNAQSLVVPTARAGDAASLRTLQRVDNTVTLVLNLSNPSDWLSATVVNLPVGFRANLFTNQSPLVQPMLGQDAYYGGAVTIASSKVKPLFMKGAADSDLTAAMTEWDPGFPASPPETKSLWLRGTATWQTTDPWPTGQWWASTSI